MQLQPSTLQVAMANAKTLSEMVALYSSVPPIRSCSVARAVYVKRCSSDPYTVTTRPCDSGIEKAQKFLNDETKSRQEPHRHQDRRKRRVL